MEIFGKIFDKLFSVHPFIHPFISHGALFAVGSPSPLYNDLIRQALLGAPFPSLLFFLSK
jgi:hypothetical protein